MAVQTYEAGTTKTALIEMRGITKRFGTLIACDSVDLHVEPGTLHAIMGENGAGKTTLMRVLYGYYQPDAGEVWLKGQRVHFRSPADAIAYHIGMVSQHYSIIPELTILDNLMLGAEQAGRFGILHRREALERARQLASALEFEPDWNRPAETLSVAARQKLEILKLLWRNAEILILDEPTAMLSPTDVETLFATLLRLKAEGRTILLVTHKLSEVLQYADWVTVMRGGRKVAETRVSEVDADQLTRWIIGEEGNGEWGMGSGEYEGSGQWAVGSGEIEGSGEWGVGSGENALTRPAPASPHLPQLSLSANEPVRHSERSEESQTLRFAQGDEERKQGDGERKTERGQGGEVEIPRLRLGMTEMVAGEGSGVRAKSTPRLTIQDLYVRSERGGWGVQGLSLKLYPGEIVGLAGVDGNGQNELMEALAGVRPIAKGTLLLDETDFTHRPTLWRLQHGIRYLFDDRFRRGMVPQWSVLENAILGAQRDPELQRLGWLRLRAVRQRAESLIRRFEVKVPSLNAPILQLSGGNQQRLVIARTLYGNPRLLIAYAPTRGLDIKGTSATYQAIRQACEQGMSALVIALDLDELMTYTDRIAVLYKGQIIGEFERAQFSREAIGAKMVGANLSGVG